MSKIGRLVDSVDPEEVWVWSTTDFLIDVAPGDRISRILQRELDHPAVRVGTSHISLSTAGSVLVDFIDCS